MEPESLSKLEVWDIQDSLNTPEDCALYLEAVFEDGDRAQMTRALGDIARSKGMAQISEQTGLTRAALYKALGPNGNPRLSTLLDVMEALGLRLTAKAAAE